MAIQVVNSTTYTAATETDLYTNSSGTLYTLSLNVSVFNGDSSSHAVEIWRCSSANVHLQCLYKSSVGAGLIIGDSSLYGIKPGEKLRFTVTGATGAVIISATLYDGLA